MSGGYSADFIVLGIDLIGYSLRPLQSQRKSQEILDEQLSKAVRNLGWPDNLKPIWIDAGDGGYALFKSEDAKVIDTLFEFQRLLADDNQSRDEQSKIYMRYALHKDQIYCWEGAFGPKYTGDALNNCARLLSGMSKEYKGQVVCSEPIFKAISAMQTPNVDVTRLKDVTDKHGKTHQVYNLQRTPGLGVTPVPTDQHQNPLKRHQSI
ncbi:hypothetical protein E0I74_29275 [Rhizobium laguerreae]|uniref:hypothetical protein n=1 Tax=Rhizobium laguerreae TaxID=1076926 RepID=UPI001039159A|nr:hypothetical protein [Rhizobium laguerreae]MBY3256701.1 hypothetical protein [Rhizobium laguerreae]MBY3281885.1 hypothetical protein [Rhizobium laguerreae]MBY3291589.1 hypothetical protein [Rhizobium laguerreae]MBY3313357.1 hypothetical protein [Rhizobium laguerreae]MBY3322761.1 hypothetical protein [Rhizobium laguerreae]